MDNGSRGVIRSWRPIRLNPVHRPVEEGTTKEMFRLEEEERHRPGKRIDLTEDEGPVEGTRCHLLPMQAAVKGGTSARGRRGEGADTRRRGRVRVD
jgi:hypothetical protein